jgi:hypothetical protein
MEQVLHIFNYLKHHEQSNLVFDPHFVDWDESWFQNFDWTDFYKGASESVPPSASEPWGDRVQMNVFVDADHAGNQVTRRSTTGILLYLNCAPIMWYSKARSTVELSTFGSEFVAIRIAVDLIESIRYKLRMFGVPLQGTANVF